MDEDDPASIHRMFAAAFNARDLDGLVALYEPEAVLVPGAGQRATGRDAIRQALAGFLAGFQSIELTTRGVVRQGDIALLYPEFRLHGTGQDSRPTTLEGHGTEVVRRQAYGTWLFAIDDPFSTA
jgi:uncharacterized protein (TIGR02246 family)